VKNSNQAFILRKTLTTLVKNLIKFFSDIQDEVRRSSYDCNTHRTQSECNRAPRRRLHIRLMKETMSPQGTKKGSTRFIAEMISANWKRLLHP